MTLLRIMRFALLCAVFAVRDVLRPRRVILQELPLREGMTAGGWFVLSGTGKHTYTFGRTEA
jgi:hypothetical protein